MKYSTSKGDNTKEYKTLKLSTIIFNKKKACDYMEEKGWGVFEYCEYCKKWLQMHSYTENIHLEGEIIM